MFSLTTRVFQVIRKSRYLKTNPSNREQNRDSERVGEIPIKLKLSHVSLNLQLDIRKISRAKKR